MMNMYWELLSFSILLVPGRKWYRAIDTSLASPNDIATQGQEPEITSDHYQVNDRSVVVLISK
jgi:isoamylase